MIYGKRYKISKQPKYKVKTLELVIANLSVSSANQSLYTYNMLEIEM